MEAVSLLKSGAAFLGTARFQSPKLVSVTAECTPRPALALRDHLKPELVS